MRYFVKFFQGEWHAGYYRPDGYFFSCGTASSKSGADSIKTALCQQDKAARSFVRRDQALRGVRF